jgi:hypothetical protein
MKKTNENFSPGLGAQYATPFAFKLTKKIKEANPGSSLGKGPKAGKDGVKNNIYVEKFNYKLVNPKKLAKQSKAIDVKQLWEEDSSLYKFQEDRIKAFDLIFNEINQISSKLRDSKNETIEYYKNNPQSYSVIIPTDLILDYLKDITELLKQ